MLEKSEESGESGERRISGNERELEESDQSLSDDNLDRNRSGFQEWSSDQVSILIKLN